MYNRNKEKIIQEQKNQELNNKKSSTFKNLYAKIRQNIKTSFPRSKQKNSLNIIKSKKLTENASKKNNNHDMNLILIKKEEESRNYRTHNEAKNIYDNNHDDDDLLDCEDNNEISNCNKSQRNAKIFTNNNSKRLIITNLKISNNDSKCDELDMNYRNNQLNYYSNKDNYNHYSNKEELKKYNINEK